MTQFDGLFRRIGLVPSHLFSRCLRFSRKICGLAMRARLPRSFRNPGLFCHGVQLVHLDLLGESFLELSLKVVSPARPYRRVAYPQIALFLRIRIPGFDPRFDGMEHVGLSHALQSPANRPLEPECHARLLICPCLGVRTIQPGAIAQQSLENHEGCLAARDGGLSSFHVPARVLSKRFSHAARTT